MGLLQRLRSATLGSLSSPNATSIDASDKHSGKTVGRNVSGVEALSDKEVSTTRASSKARHTGSLNVKHRSSSSTGGSPPRRQSHRAISSASSVPGSPSRRHYSSERTSASKSTTGASGRRGRPSSKPSKPWGQSRSTSPAISRRQDSPGEAQGGAVRQHDAIVRQQEAAVRLSRGSAAHQSSGFTRHKSSSSPPYSLSTAYQERHMSNGSPPLNHPLQQPNPGSAGNSARPNMSNTRTAGRISTEIHRDASPVKTHPGFGQPVADSSPASGSSRRTVNSTPLRRRMGVRGVPVQADVNGAEWGQMSSVAISPDSRAALHSKQRKSAQPGISLGDTEDFLVGRSGPGSPEATDTAQLKAQHVPRADRSSITAVHVEEVLQIPAVDLSTQSFNVISIANADTSISTKLVVDVDSIGAQPLSATGKTAAAHEAGKRHMSPSFTPELPPPVSRGLGPATPSPLALVPLSAQPHREASPDPIRSLPQDTATLRVSLGPVITAASVAENSGMVTHKMEIDKDSDTMAAAKGPDTPQANKESPFANPAAQNATDSSSAATSGSASKTSTTFGIKQMSPPPPGPKVKTKKSAPVPPLSVLSTRSLFGSCCSSMPAVKGDPPPPIKRQDSSSKVTLQGPPPRTPIRHNRRLSNCSVHSDASFEGSIGSPSLAYGLSHTTLEYCGNEPTQRHGKRPDGKKPTFPLGPPTPSAQDLANINDPASPQENTRGRRKARGSRHRRSNSATSMSSLESYHSTASFQSLASQHSVASQHSKSFQRRIALEKAEMQVKGFYDISIKGNTSSRPLRSALRSSHSRDSLDDSEQFSPGFSSSAPSSGSSAVKAATSEIFNCRASSTGGGLTRSASGISLHSLAEGTDEGTAGNDTMGPSGTSVCSHDSNSSLVSTPSGSVSRTYLESPTGAIEPATLSRSRGSTGRGAVTHEIRLASPVWSLSSPENSGAPSPPVTRSNSSSLGYRSLDRSMSTELLADVEKVIKASTARRSSSLALRPASVSPPPPDVFNSGGSTGRSPGSQLQQMRHLREKVHIMRAETERNLAHITMLAVDARTRRGAHSPVTSNEPSTAPSPRSVVHDGMRLQEQKAKLQRRLEQLSMQQMRLEMRIQEAAEAGAVSLPPPEHLHLESRTSPSLAASDSSAASLSPSPKEVPERGVITGGTVSEPLTPKTLQRRVTFGTPSPLPPPQTLSTNSQKDSTYVNVVDTVAGLRSMVGPSQPQHSGSGSGNSLRVQVSPEEPLTRSQHETTVPAGFDTPRRSRRHRSSRNGPSPAAGKNPGTMRSMMQDCPIAPLQSRLPLPELSSPPRHRRTRSTASEGASRGTHTTSEDAIRKRSLPGPIRARNPPPTGSVRSQDGDHGRTDAGSRGLSGRSSSSNSRSEVVRPSWLDEAVTRSGGRAF